MSETLVGVTLNDVGNERSKKEWSSTEEVER